MAGNIKADKSGDIYVEFDYNNIILVDPNKTIDATGKVRERLIDTENMVMYANLEAEVLPRTKLAVGGAPNDRIRTISVAKINFLKPTEGTYFTTGYDALTGKGSLEGKAQNQMSEKTIIPKDGSKPYNVIGVLNPTDILDNGFLGITQINITTNTSFVPTVTIELEDIQGRALFQLGDASPYSAFFNLPYPQFYLTLKGYVGQAVRYQLNLEKFHARFNSFSGNYQVSLTFKGYKFNILNEIALGHLVATPHMYGKKFTVATTTESLQTSNKAAVSSSNTANKIAGQASNSPNETVTQITSEKGYEKIIEVYSEYKAKGLIPLDLPELTLVQLMNKLETFETTISNSFPKSEVESLTNIRNYREVLQKYFATIRGATTSWFNTYLNPTPIILAGGNKIKVYGFKVADRTVNDPAIDLLKANIKEYNDGLAGNPTVGSAGPTPIPNPIKYEMIALSSLSTSQIDWIETTRQLTGNPNPSSEQVQTIISRFSYIFLPIVNQNQIDTKKSYTNVKPDFFVFEGNGKFDWQIESLDTQATKKLSEYETKISAELLRKIEDKSIGIGFKPTVRNMIAVIMASAEAFIRLMDDVHTNAWNVKYDPVRQFAILDNPSSAPGSDTKQNLSISLSAQADNQGLVTAKIPVYPWPQFFVETNNAKKGRSFELKYLADPSVVDFTQGYLFEKWPEVEFVEEYMKGLTQKFSPPIAPPPLENDRDTNIININAIEFPSLGLAYINKEEVKFFYEIWERQFLTSHYSGLIRANQSQINDLITLNIQTETSNIVTSLGASSPYLTAKLKYYDFTAKNYPTLLYLISNDGTGRSYQDYQRDFFVTPYIKEITENSFSILDTLNLGKIPQISAHSTALENLIAKASNTPLIVDTLPYTDAIWCLDNLGSSTQSIGNEVYNVKETLTIFPPKRIIANFTDINNFTVNRPVTNFSYLLDQNPLVYAQIGLNAFYKTRKIDDFVATEGTCNSKAPVPLKDFPYSTTTSMLNTPYFINAVQNGVENFKNNDTYPYVQAAYLFLNSLPLATLRERYKSLSADGNETITLDYIASCFKKFGAIHKVPYAWVLKYGSIWHRYKKFKESKIDILASAWKNFDYVTNYSPTLSSVTQTYSFSYSGIKRDVTLQTETSTDVNMQVGFYPKLINDYNVFLNGYTLYTDYSSEEIQKSINCGLKMYNFPTSNIVNAKQGDKNLRLNTWSILLPSSDMIDCSDCDPVNNTASVNYYVIPSFGTKLNQTNDECISNQTTIPSTTVDLTFNPSVYNGSVRSLWSASNYGYFDSNQIAYPQPDSYLCKINTDDTQSPFTLLTEDNYSKIEEIFSVFDKSILNSFEEEFLNWCKPVTNLSTGEQYIPIGDYADGGFYTFKNFQSFYRSIMTVPYQSKSINEEQYFSSTVDTQYTNFVSGIHSLLNYDVILKYGNPSNYKRRIFDSYLSYNNSQKVVDPISFKPYVVNTLPTAGGTVSLTNSKLQNPDAWVALELEVGFSTINGVRYSSNGSYITDFFVDNNIEFTSQNVTLLAPIIKMYATQKLKDPRRSVAQFQNQISSYLSDETTLQNNILDQILTAVRRALPDQQQLPERAVKSVITGEQSKVENYEVFKALNDKWIAGTDYKTKTLFEDILFLDRASRNIGDTLLIDIFSLKDMFNEKSLNMAMSVFTFISGILIKNNFNIMNLPAYVNFYNVQDVSGTVTPPSEGSLEFANSLWGTFLDVDYRKSGPKIVCFYAGKPSQYLQLPHANSRFRDDAFDLVRSSENPLIEDQQGKKDWAVSNKCVGFNVDIGIRNQNVFQSFSVSQDNGTATSESINTQINMVDQATGKNTSTQNVGLYNLYKQRSYKCSVIGLGNALIQPTMYFNLRHVPMFNGPYLIQDVTHHIQAGNFTTTFNGIRQGIFDLPAIDSFLQSMNQNLLTELEGLLKIKKNTFTVTATTNNAKTDALVQKANNSPDTTNSCKANLDAAVYANYEDIKTVLTTATPQQFAQALTRVLGNNPDLQSIIYRISYVLSFQTSSSSKTGVFNGWNNNFGLISLKENWNNQIKYFLRTYSCVNVKTTASKSASLPMANFKDLDTYINFMADRLRDRVGQINDIGLDKFYVCYWSKDNVAPDYYDSHLSSYTEVRNTLKQALSSARDVKILTTEELIAADAANKKTQSKGKSPGVTPTPPVVTPLPGKTCPPPVISSFSPTVGNTGTIGQINGRNLETVKSISVIDTIVPYKDITIIDDNTLRFVIPQVGTGKLKKVGKIVVTTPNGSFSSTSDFVYDPALNPAAASSPGDLTKTTTSAVPTTTTNLNTIDTNPQNTGPQVLVVTNSTKNSIGSATSLTVGFNPDAGGWIIDSNPLLRFFTVKKVMGPNGVLIEELGNSSSDGKYLVGYVSVDKQEFSITSNQMIYELDLGSEEYVNGKVYIMIEILATPLDPERYSQDTTRSFPFNLIFDENGLGNITSDTISAKVTQPIRQVSITKINPDNGRTDSVSLVGSGPQYYNIQKPDGNFITYQLFVDGYNPEWVVQPITVLDENNVETTFTSKNTTDTKYTNQISVNGLGVFKLKIQYYPYGPNAVGGNEVKLETVYSEPFTL
jgi:hypothetical protein